MTQTDEALLDYIFKGDNELWVFNGYGEKLSKKCGNKIFVEYSETEGEFQRSVEPYDLEILTPTSSLKKVLTPELLYNDTMVRYNKIRHRVKKRVEQIVYSKNNAIKYARIFIGDKNTKTGITNNITQLNTESLFGNNKYSTQIKNYDKTDPLK